MNKYENMEIASFDDIDDVYELIIDKMIDLEDPTEYIAVYSKVDLIKELFTTMISEGYEFGYADFDTLDEMRKDMIYMMFIRGNGVVSVEPAYSKDGVVMGHDAKVVLFYMDDCKQDAIDYCVNRDMEVILFDFEDLECNECCDCCQCDSEKSVASSPNIKESYTVNGKSVTREEFDKKCEEFEEMYLDNIRDMLLNYCSFMDSVNDWRKLLRW